MQIIEKPSGERSQAISPPFIMSPSEASIVSETRFADLVETLAANVTDVEALFAAKRNAASKVAAKPAADNTRTDLCACCLETSSRLSLFSTVRTFYSLRSAHTVHAWHSLVSLELLCAKKLSKFILTGVLLSVTAQIIGLD